MATEIERERAYDLPDGVTVPDLTGRAGIAEVAGARSAGAEPLAASKLERTLADRLVTARAPAVPGRAAAAVFDYLRAQRDALVAEYPGARGGDVDAVHDMRVATRRLRATLRTFRGLWDRHRVDAVRRDLSWLGHRLGALRDGQVMADRLAAAAHAEPPELVIGPVAARLQQRYAGAAGEAHTRLREALDSRRYLDLLIALDELVDTPPPHRRGNRWALKRARRTLSRADEALDTALAHRDLPGGRATTGLTSNELLHEARKAYKKGRYAAEALAVVGGKPAKRLIKQLKAVQDTLGDHHDTVTARAELRQQAMRAYQDRDNTFTYGLLYARADDTARQALREVEPAVRRARSRKVRRWLD